MNWIILQCVVKMKKNLKIERIEFPINPFYPNNKALPLNQWVRIKETRKIKIFGKIYFRERFFTAKIGETGLYIGDSVVWEKGYKKEFVVGKLTLKIVNNQKDVKPTIYERTIQDCIINDIIEACKEDLESKQQNKNITKIIKEIVEVCIKNDRI